jgi:hypothetical protein
MDQEERLRFLEEEHAKREQAAADEKAGRLTQLVLMVAVLFAVLFFKGCLR